MIQANNSSEKEINQIVDLLAKNNSGLIALAANPSADAVAAGTALYLALTKAGKSVSIVSSTTPQSDLAAADKIVNNLTSGGDNLVVSFPYSDGSIDKVDYNIQGNTFNLVIVPRKDFPKIEPKQVQFSYTGGKVEFIFTIDVPNLNSIGPLYQQNQNEFQGKNIINIDRHLINNNFGVINYVNKTSSSTTELVLKVIEGLKVEIDKDMASNMYAGLVAATNNFTSYSVNADTFEIASKLLKHGAIKKPMARPGMPGQPGTRFAQPGQPNPYFPSRQPGMPSPMAMPMDEEDDLDDFPPMNNPMPMRSTPMTQQSMPQMPVPQMPQQAPQAPTQQDATPIEGVESKSQGGPETQSTDWLKPKIFPGQGLI